MQPERRAARSFLDNNLSWGIACAAFWPGGGQSVTFGIMWLRHSDGSLAAHCSVPRRDASYAAAARMMFDADTDIGGACYAGHTGCCA